ncbi:hypothetical protein KIN_32960 [Litoreibacter roseus]|uniref:Uncharacterized protein n=1 Tax=Litoreibacter roseus TaxID=2601869 RepID=A0A6N6JM01_9RHOB|nr:hypothetical protein KIN_32960 [Litoreibacter roseus]
MFSGALNQTACKNLFNPSFAQREGGFDIAFRALPANGEKPFHAFFQRIDTSGQLDGDLVDLSTRFQTELGYPVADPKICTLDNETWLTFNTGHFQRPNNIYLVRLSPEPSQLYRVDYFERRNIEKNWAFFLRDGVLHALYDLDPLTVLRESNRRDGVISFERLQARNLSGEGPDPKASKTPKLTIGTQLAGIGSSPDSYVLVAHRRFYWRGKRIYLGKPVRFDAGRDGFSVRFSPDVWAHSLSALAGSKPKHNPNLLSCTYFSGIMVSNDHATLGYGVNDVGHSIAQIPLSRWPKAHSSAI